MNVLVVDDEPIIRQVLRTMIDWESEGLRWYGEAEDGADAWEAVKTGAVDIVVTDILMPRMDGLELVRKLNGGAKRVAVVVLSCLDDFQYVKEAMKLGARDYILKPTMEPENLAIVLREAKESLLRERSEAEEFNRIRIQLEQSRQSQTGAELRRMLETDAEPNEGAFRRLFPEEETFTNTYASYMFYLAAGFPWTSGDWSSPEAFAVIPWSERQAMLIFEGLPAGSSQGNLFDPEQAIARLKRLVEERSVTFDTPCYVSAIPGIRGIGGLKAALDRHREEREQYFYGNVRAAAETGEELLPQAEKHNLLRALSGGNSNAVMHALAEIGNRIRARQPNAELVYDYFQELLSFSAAFARQHNEWLDLNDFGKTYLSPEAPRRHLQFETLLRETESAMTGLLELLSGSGYEWMESRNPFIRKAYEYMQAHYHLPISTTDIADHVRLSRSYISDLYGKETGESLSEALTRIRMDAAKKLLKSGNRKVYEIAEAVGFNDAKAFAKTFKRMVGCTPKEYVELM
ncbi:response regulator [Paenibacillus allorhizosphaerae]|uniref:Protein-glutamate methylesterase/protein-glutamine glutaminase n=1 Tax=Paenibacillus allorhizosphaerae TaxID=2849866 RepID=A0ABM8VE17_9BACL|nr:response regulator [Paenibacillus allorhizosphaerae]CAG7629626.1 Protein-glutamate methylesterase/protein-glutamine glutaminase [Paenibacillus allorhizosphaerae]